jgi:pimeloyl-ACP methyl ester carboxylesterase
LAALLDTLGLAQVALVGHSDGGTIALYFAARHPQRVRALVTVAAHVYVDPTMQPGMEALRQVYERSEAFRRALDRTHAGRGDAVFEMWYQGWHRPEVRNWDARPLLRHVEAPTLVVQGTADEYAPPSHAEAIAAALPNARLALVPEAPHTLPQEHAAAFNTLLLDFLADYRPSDDPTI